MKKRKLIHGWIAKLNEDKNKLLLYENLKKKKLNLNLFEFLFSKKKTSKTIYTIGLGY